MRAYPEYKDSGVEWLGEIPSHWQLAALGRCGYFSGGCGFPHEYQGVAKGNLPFYKVSDTNLKGNEKYLINAENYVTQQIAIKLGATINSPGGIMFPKVGAALLGNKRRILSTNGITDNNIMVFSPKEKDSDYWYYWLSIIDLGQLSNPGPVPSVNESQLKTIKVVLPLLTERKSISNYLDRETTRIDKLISEKQNFIKLLKEKRQALISHVVTKGLDPHVKMKKSGIEWIGEVPEHWDIVKFSHFISIRNGQVDPATPPWDEYTLIAPNHIESMSGKIIKRETAREQGADSGKYLCKKGEVIYSKIRPALAKACLCDEDLTICSADMYPMKCNYRMLNGYLLWLILSNEFTRFTILESDRVAMPKINRDSLAKIRFPVPSIEEQRKGLRNIEKNTSNIEDLIQETTTSINLLKEHRTALISAAVTGKIDVRDHAK